MQLPQITTYCKDKRIQKCFFSAVFWGLLSYLYCFMNNLNNYDNIACTPGGYGTGMQSGRWFLSLLGECVKDVWGNYNLPFFNGLLSILFMGISACMVIEILEIKNEWFCALLGGITVVFPPIASGMLFSFTVHYYTLAILLSVAGVWCVKQRKIVLYILGGLLFACSLGIYQAYFPFAASLLILTLIKMCLDETYSWKQVLLASFKFLSALLIGYILYRILLQICLVVYDQSLNSYQGINEMGNIDLRQLPHMVIQTYKDLLKLPLRDYMSITATRVLQHGVFWIYIICFVSAILFFMRKNVLKSIALVVLVALFPIAVNSIIIMVPNGNVYTLMAMALVAVFYLPLVFVDNITVTREKLTKLLTIPTVAVLFICTLNYTWLNNGNYRALYYSNKQLENYYSTLYTRIKSTENYRQDQRILFIGSKITDNTYKNNWNSTPFRYGGNEARLNTYSRASSIINYLGYSYHAIAFNSDEYKKYESEIQTMSCYPDDGSIRVVDDVVLVRLE